MDILTMLRECFEDSMHHKSKEGYQVIKMNGPERPFSPFTKWL